MALIDDIANIVHKVPLQWREDFCLLVEGETPSEEFERYFDANLDCQNLMERVIKRVDHDFVVQLAK